MTETEAISAPRLIDEQLPLLAADDKRLFGFGEDSRALRANMIWLVGLLTSTVAAGGVGNLVIALTHITALSTILTLMVLVGGLFLTYRLGDKHINRKLAEKQSYRKEYAATIVSQLRDRGWEISPREAEALLARNRAYATHLETGLEYHTGSDVAFLPNDIHVTFRLPRELIEQMETEKHVTAQEKAAAEWQGEHDEGDVVAAFNAGVEWAERNRF
jgi:hypothetical protein